MTHVPAEAAPCVSGLGVQLCSVCTEPSSQEGCAHTQVEKGARGDPRLTEGLTGHSSRRFPNSLTPNSNPLHSR